MRENVFRDKALQKYLQDISDYKPLKREEEKELIIKAQNNDERARDKLIESNLKFVVRVAAKYQNRGLLLSQLISEGNVGLIKAIKKFDPSKNIKLISYAVWWIKQRILFALAEKRSTIRVPLGKANDTIKVNGMIKAYRKKHGKRPKIHEIVESTGIREDVVRKIRKKYSSTVSLDSSLNNDDDFTLNQVLVDESVENPEEHYHQSEINRKIVKSLDKLTKRESYIVRSYFGLEGTKKMNFSKLGKELGLSRERVRQIQNKALKVLYKDLWSEHNKDIEFLINSK